MPTHCYLKADLRCPYCGTFVTDRVTFHWGYSSGRFWPEEKYYRLGDSICWRYCLGMGIFSWASFHHEPYTSEGMNIGDPHLRDLVVLDKYTEFAMSGVCASCSGVWSGAAVEIRDNSIRRAWLYKPDEFDSEADIYLLRDQERLVPLPEWRDHYTPAVYGCSEWQLVVPYVQNGFLHIPKE